MHEWHKLQGWSKAQRESSSWQSLCVHVCSGIKQSVEASAVCKYQSQPQQTSNWKKLSTSFSDLVWDSVPEILQKSELSLWSLRSLYHFVVKTLLLCGSSIEQLFFNQANSLKRSSGYTSCEDGFSAFVLSSCTIRFQPQSDPLSSTNQALSSIWKYKPDVF